MSHDPAVRLVQIALADAGLGRTSRLKREAFRLDRDLSALGRLSLIARLAWIAAVFARHLDDDARSALLEELTAAARTGQAVRA